jgi:5-methylcytosine-specific restriction endonuclease McrA
MLPNKKVLLLNSAYEVLHLISAKKALRLIIKEKVDIVSIWDNVRINTISKVFNFPAIIKLKYYVKRNIPSKILFSRNAILKRDNNRCQYCNKILISGQITIDHVLPKCKGGLSTFTNCVASCETCNKKKGKKTLIEANMTLIKEPATPSKYIQFFPEDETWHNEWKLYIKS